MTGSPLPTAVRLDEIAADPSTSDIATLLEWCRNLLADREEALKWADAAGRERDGMAARIRAVADLCDMNPDSDWAPVVRAVLRGQVKVGAL